MSSISTFFSKFMGGTSTEREVKRMWPVVAEVNRHAEAFASLSDDELKAKTQEFRYRLSREDATVDDLLPEAYAAVKETCRRLIGRKWLVRGQEIVWNMVPYDVQILGAVVLHQGKIAEMATGEGKTLVATMPLYLNALTGKGAHLVTVNDYLAQRDCEWMGKIFDFLGLTAAALHGEMTPEERRQAYNADITYGTNNEFGFDYLRDNMATDVWSVAQRKLNYAIVDEVDSVLIDESRTPLIISGSVGAPRNIYYELKPIVANLYRRQKDLIAELLRKGKELLEQDEEAAGMALLRVHRGDPKNAQLLELLTSEFWVKKLIEGIQSEHEINKEMGSVDGELYYTIDEKSHVVDITEKGRIFLSGGRDQDLVAKIELLDRLDERLGAVAEQKNVQRFYTQDPVSGLCNGITPAGQVVLAAPGKIADEALIDAAAALAARIAQLAQQVSESAQQQKIDKSAAWRHYYLNSRKLERMVVGLTEEAKRFLLAGNAAPLYTELVQNYADLLQDMDAFDAANRVEAELRREWAGLWFELDKSSNAPTALRPDGVTAILIRHFDGDLSLLPAISKMTALLATGSTDTLDERRQEYFEFTGKGAIPRHIAEKGRIAMLGGNPDLYILPDRSLVEERDRGIQNLLDRTLNQSGFDYAERVMAIEEIERDVDELHKLDTGDTWWRIDPGTRRFQFTTEAAAILSGHASQTHALIQQLDEELRREKNQAGRIFNLDPQGRYVGLAAAELDRLLGLPFAAVAEKISEWKQQNAAALGGAPVRLRLSLDHFLATAFPQEQPVASLSRQFEEVERLHRTMQVIFEWFENPDMSAVEKSRHLHRYFEFDAPAHELRPESTAFLGLSDNGLNLLRGASASRQQIWERLLHLTNSPDLEQELLFVLDDHGLPVALKKTARALLLEGLPFFSYRDELHRFREEVLLLATKKATTQAEFESLLAKDKAHLRGKHFQLDDREMNELIFKAHSAKTSLTSEEIEHWLRIHIERKPRRLLEEQRDNLWKEYTAIEERVQNISQLLRAYTLYHRDVDYVVKALDDADLRGRVSGKKGANAVMIVDQFTGRLMPGRRYSDGLHEALEAKEGVEVQAESQTLATITIQNFFRLYDKLAGMTGTAETEAQEFFSTYKLEVMVIPTNKPVIRNDENDVIYRTRKEKYNAIVEEAISMHEQGRSVLVGTISVEVSQLLSDMLTQRGVPIANWLKKGDVTHELESGRFHTVLNAKFHRQEAEIVTKAGLPGSITIATNMAGRGTDIKLHHEVARRGGLHIIGSEKHEARRIDRQLRGRSGRQGDPGSSRFYLSLEDDLMRLFGSDRITTMMSRLGPMEENERIEHPLITRSIERAQKKVEERNFEIRKHLLDYDNVLNEQRKIIYKRRQNLLGFAGPEDLVESKAKRYFNEEDERTEWDLAGLLANLEAFFHNETGFTVQELEPLKFAEIKELLIEWIGEQIEAERLQRQMQLRHRLLGYTPFAQTLEELVHLKIRLHSAGTRDTAKWNLTGIRDELERIYGTSPQWLAAKDIPADAAELEQRLVQWAARHYQEHVARNREGLDLLLFLKLETEEMAMVYLRGLMEAYLPEKISPHAWKGEEFLNGLDRVFSGKPPVGIHEIRTIRREKLLQMIQSWIRERLPHLDASAMRHRIVGFFSLANFIDVVVRYLLIDLGSGRTDRLDERQIKFLHRLFGDVTLPDVTAASEEPLEERLSRQLSIQYRTQMDEKRDAYLEAMLHRASIEEFMAAALTAMVRSVAAGPSPIEQKQADLASRLGFVLMQRPAKAMPDTRDGAEIASFAEDIVAWALKWYETYAEREERFHQETLSGEIVRDSVLMMIEDTVYAMISGVMEGETELDSSKVRRIESECRLVFRQAPRLSDDSGQVYDPNEIMTQLNRWARQIYQKRIEELGSERAMRYERYFVLEKIDENWRQHLNATDEVREGIGLRGYGQKDPLLEYKSEAYNLFVKMIDRINRDVVATLFKYFDVGGELEERQMRRIEPKNFMTTHSQVETFKQGAPRSHAESPAAVAAAPARTATVVRGARVGRNDPCPCGSGKKYKQCCGKNA